MARKKTDKQLEAMTEQELMQLLKEEGVNGIVLNRTRGKSITISYQDGELTQHIITNIDTKKDAYKALYKSIKG